MKIALDPLKPVSLKEQLVYQIEDMIRSRQAPVGTRLPSIRQLATANRVSRFPVMEAYDHLVSRGWRSPRGIELPQDLSGLCAGHFRICTGRPMVVGANTVCDIETGAMPGLDQTERLYSSRVARR